jgi:hypothetical protein
MKSSITRRQVLRGMLQGSAVTVALPFLECFLNSNGTALASGAPLPTRFATWFWGLGMSSNVFVPKKLGADFDLPEELASLEPIRQHINLFTRFKVASDGKPNFCHYTGWVALRCGTVPGARTDLPGESLDLSIGDVMGNGTRFRSLNATATGNPRDSYSFRGANAYSPTEVSHVDLYKLVFGPDFSDPNSPTFTPNPRIMVQKSVLSAVSDERAALDRTLGSEDRARLDEYFTGLRQVEQQLALQLNKPEPMPSCKVPKANDTEVPAGLDSQYVATRHRLMTDILAMALACNQTKVVNMVYANSGSLVTRTGLEKAHHTLTHEEIYDDKLGYQPQVSWFTRRAMESWSYFVAALARIPEGDGTLLDHMLVYAHSDQEYAKIHSLDGIPMFTAGRASGKVKTGLHIDGAGQPGTRLGLTVQRIMGVDVSSWGSGSNNAGTEISEIRA